MLFCSYGQLQNYISCTVKDMSDPYQYMHPSFMYTSEPVEKTPVRESYASTPQQKVYTKHSEPSPRLWINYLWNSVHVMARTYDPTIDPNVRKSFSCFYQSLAGILPTADSRKIMTNFISVTKEVQKTLLESKELTSFFTVHRDIYSQLAQRPGEFFTSSLKDSDSLFAWTLSIPCILQFTNRRTS